MLTYNMDVEERSVWLRATPNNAVLAQPFYATEAGLFYGRSHFATARTDKESYILFYTLAGAGLIEQNEQHIELPQGAALLMNCRTPQSYCTAPGYDVWEHYWVHLDGVGVKTLADSVQSQGRLTAAHVSRMEMQPLFETLFAEWKKETTTAHQLFNSLGFCTRVVVSITFHQVDYAPDTKAGTDCNDQCLKNIDCTAKKSHNQMCEQTLFLMVCKRLALLLSLLFRPFFTCFICKAILSLSSLFSPFFLLLDFFLEKT